MTSVICKWKKCDSNKDGVCNRDAIVLEEYVVSPKAPELLNCISYTESRLKNSEEGKANGQV